jgi:hypothetical protein
VKRKSYQDAVRTVWRRGNLWDSRHPITTDLVAHQISGSATSEIMSRDVCLLSEMSDLEEFVKM